MPVWYLFNTDNIDLKIHLNHETACPTIVEDKIWAWYIHPVAGVHRAQVARLRESNCVCYKNRKDLYVALNRPVPVFPRGRPKIYKSPPVEIKPKPTPPPESSESEESEDDYFPEQPVKIPKQVLQPVDQLNDPEPPKPTPIKQFNLFDLFF